MRFLALPLFLFGVGCAVEVSTTSEPDRRYAERHQRLVVADAVAETLLIVGSSDALDVAASALVGALVPVVEGPPVSGLWLQLVAMSPQAAVSALEARAACARYADQCDAVQPPTVTFHAFPYGYGTDLAEWSAHTTCLLRGGTSCFFDEAPIASFATDGHPLVVIWLEDDTECDPGAPCATQPLDRARTLHEQDPTPGSWVLHVAGEAPSVDTLQRLVDETYDPRDRGAWSVIRGDRVALDAERLPRCIVRETLPLTGSIARCEQLIDHGRAFEFKESSEHDVCRLVPRAAPTSVEEAEPGYYFQPDHVDGPSLVLVIDPIPGSQLDVFCELESPFD